MAPCAEGASPNNTSPLSKRPAWVMPTRRDHIPPLTALPPLPSPRSPSPSPRGKPIFHPIKPLELPFVPSKGRESPPATTMAATIAAASAVLGEAAASEGALAAAERHYAQLCVLKEEGVTRKHDTSPRARRTLRESSQGLCRQYLEMGVAAMERSGARGASTTHAVSACRRRRG